MCDRQYLIELNTSFLQASAQSQAETASIEFSS